MRACGCYCYLPHEVCKIRFSPIFELRSADARGAKEVPRGLHEARSPLALAGVASDDSGGHLGEWRVAEATVVRQAKGEDSMGRDEATLLPKSGRAQKKTYGYS